MKLISSVIIPDGVERVPNMEEQLKEYYPLQEQRRYFWRTLMQPPWKSWYEISKDHILIYFDHKLADMASVPSKLLAGPVAYNIETKDYHRYRVITNCEDMVYKDDTKEDIGEEVMQTLKFHDDHTCPQAFYKTIPYTWGGELLPPSHRGILALLREKRSMTDKKKSI